MNMSYQMKRVLLLLTGIVFSTGLKAQQDVQFTQYLFNGLHINPAYAGAKEDLYVQSFYRSQWQGIPGAPKSFSVAADGAFNEGSVGLGIIVTNDQLGAQSNLSAYANYAYRLRLNADETSTLSFGLAAGMMQLGLDANKLQAINPGDAAIPLSSQTRIYPDARFGIYYTSEKYFAGFSATNVIARYMAKKNSAELLIPVPQAHLYFTAGALFPINEDVQLKPVVLLKEDLQAPATLDLTAFLLLKEKIWIGGFYRTTLNLFSNNLQAGLPKTNSLGLITEVFVSPDVRIGYSYDYSINKLRDYNSGSHELSVGFYLSRKNAGRSKLTRCYVF